MCLVLAFDCQNGKTIHQGKVPDRFPHQNGGQFFSNWCRRLLSVLGVKATLFVSCQELETELFHYFFM